nr:hypothetical protein GCM10020185_19560 [Pseudomonas brassicacearum subsp. brassicacearum]
MPQAVSDSLLGFGAGVMLAATAFSLIVPGIAAAEQLGLTPWAASGLISFGILSGAFGLYLVDRKVCACPERLVAAPGRPIIAPRIWLFVFAIIAHNIPEGMAVGGCRRAAACRMPTAWRWASPCRMYPKGW